MRAVLIRSFTALRIANKYRIPTCRSPSDKLSLEWLIGVRHKLVQMHDSKKFFVLHAVSGPTAVGFHDHGRKPPVRQDSLPSPKDGELVTLDIDLDHSRYVLANQVIQSSHWNLDTRLILVHGENMVDGVQLARKAKGCPTV